MRIFLFASLLAISLFSCKGKKEDKKTEPEQPAKDTVTVVINTAARDSALFQLTDEALTAFDKKDYEALSLLVHPDLGLRFSPYSYIDSTADKIVTAEWIKKQANKPKQQKIEWGAIDNTAEPIRMTMDKYIDAFVYDVDFIHPEMRKVNEIIGRGNTINNIAEMYPGCDFTESHFPGFDKKMEGMDWRSVRLVFKKKDGKYYLVGVIHDEWTT